MGRSGPFGASEQLGVRAGQLRPGDGERCSLPDGRASVQDCVPAGDEQWVRSGHVTGVAAIHVPGAPAVVPSLTVGPLSRSVSQFVMRSSSIGARPWPAELMARDIFT